MPSFHPNYASIPSCCGAFRPLLFGSLYEVSPWPECSAEGKGGSEQVHLRLPAYQQLASRPLGSCSPVPSLPSHPWPCAFLAPWPPSLKLLLPRLAWTSVHKWSSCLRLLKSWDYRHAHQSLFKNLFILFLIKVKIHTTFAILTIYTCTI
jgi:hypothetical protein